MASRNSHRIMDGLYLGNIQSARAPRGLTDHRITHILSVCNDLVPAEARESGWSHKRIPVENHSSTDLLIWLPDAVSYIYNAIERGGTVLVHCDTGNCRSAAVVVAYLMCRMRMRASDALHAVRQARDTIDVPIHFHEQLVLYEMCEYAPSATHPSYIRWRAMRK
ncbi:phosphatases II [Cylindrobasidium torrendii FP15055 ss-10]|uniref:protein-tyrosine-phosphatase n=1 Tax=Cylindrobasidium torrendii FP15055 ss-10 TaxID=1314674 RepID=A0A0D7BX56_9AGAR|nr:phosphatases II [Cylindrobasidium torrendii FP15055 ss-10]